MGLSHNYKEDILLCPRQGHLRGGIYDRNQQKIWLFDRIGQR